MLATEESLARVGAGNEKLVENCFNYSKNFSVGKKTKHVFSIEMGTNEFCSAKNALANQIEMKETFLDPEYITLSYYDAYVRFVNGNSTFLLGTQRDVARLENKKTQGAIQELYGEALLTSDLVQYVSALESGNERRQKNARAFCSFLTCEYVQSKLLGFGMLPIRAVDEKECQSMVLLDAYENLGKMSFCTIA